MDVLVVVGSAPAPTRLTDRALHVHRFDADEPLATLVGALRARIPRRVGVWGPVAEAAPVAAGSAPGRTADRAVHRRARSPTEHSTGHWPASTIRPRHRPGPAHGRGRLAGRADRPHAHGPTGPHRPGPGVHARRQARAVQPRRLVQGPHRPGHDRSGRAATGSSSPGGTIVEPTSGNTGVGPGHRGGPPGLHAASSYAPTRWRADKIALLRAYGAEVMVCPTSVPPEHPESYYSVSDRLAREVPLAWKPDQYHNPDNPRAQYETAGAGDLGADHGAGSPTSWPASAPGGTVTGHRPVPEGAESRRSRSSAPTPRARSTRAGRDGRTWSRASVRTSGPPPTTPRSWTGWWPSPTPRASPPPAG